MTHSTNIFAATILLTFSICTNSFAQEVTAVAANQLSYTKNSFNAKENSSTKTDFKANPAITIKFSTLFPTATNQKWSAAANNYWVSFLNNGRRANASLTKKGKLNYVIIDIAMENLPGAFSKKITNEYTSYQLLNAVEITVHGIVAYQVILEDCKGYVTLRYTSEGVEIMQQVKKH